MRETQLLRLLAFAWAAFGAYWLIAGALSTRAQTREPHWYRWARLGLLVVVFSLLFWPGAAVGVLGRGFTPALPAISYGGMAAALGGMFIAIWARVHLGRYWSDKIVLKADHQLIRTGPYACMRHPIYSGVLLGVAGTALVVGQWRGVLAFLLLLVNYSIKAKKEEALLAGHFGQSFREHAAHAGFLFPRLR